jgi:lipoprotein NlpI
LNRSRVIVLAIFVVITGCASSSSLEKRADIHSKAGSYYKSIGQPTVAREEFKSAKENRDKANNIFSILVDIFNRYNKKGQ